MKKITAIIVGGSICMMSLQGCYGKMALTKKVYAVNGEVNDKFVRSLVTWILIIVPVYQISALADFILFNTIEFWSGKNPVSLGEKDFNYASNGETYQIHAKKTGQSVSYLITHYKGQKYLDTLSINWDIASGNSVATFTDQTRTTDYNATKEKDGIIVTRHDRGITGTKSGMLAQYK
jgi:hypothetical protein